MKILKVVLIALALCAPAMAQEKKSEPAKPAVAVQPAKKKPAPRMIVTAESSELAKESGKGIVLSDTPYAGASEEEPELGESDGEKANRERVAGGGPARSGSGSSAKSGTPQHRPVVSRPKVSRPKVSRPR